MDYVVDELYSHPSAEEIKLRVLLPAEQITPELAYDAADRLKAGHKEATIQVRPLCQISRNRTSR
jgi:hypothetical protein